MKPSPIEVKAWTSDGDLTIAQGGKTYTYRCVPAHLQWYVESMIKYKVFGRVWKTLAPYAKGEKE